MKKSTTGVLATLNGRLRADNAALRKNNRELRNELRALRALHYTGRRISFRNIDCDGGDPGDSSGRDADRSTTSSR